MLLNPFKVVDWILVVVGLKAPLPCCLSPKASHNPHTQSLCSSKGRQSPSCFSDYCCAIFSDPSSTMFCAFMSSCD